MLIKRIIRCDQSSSFKYMYTPLAIKKKHRKARSVRVSLEEVVEVEEECKKKSRRIN